MGTVDLTGLPSGAVLLLDAAPVIYYIEIHPKWEPRFAPVFDAHAAGRVQLAITTTAIAEVLTGCFKRGDEGLARRYRAVLESWQRVDLDWEIAESAARLRALYGFKWSDAIQSASALAINAAALVTHDRDFSRLRGLRVIS